MGQMHNLVEPIHAGILEAERVKYACRRENTTAGSSHGLVEHLESPIESKLIDEHAQRVTCGTGLFHGHGLTYRAARTTSHGAHCERVFKSRSINLEASEMYVSSHADTQLKAKLTHQVHIAAPRVHTG